MSETNTGVEAERAKLYKNVGKTDVNDSRRRRNETSIEIRRQRRNDEMMKRRNIHFDDSDEMKAEDSLSNEGSTGVSEKVVSQAPLKVQDIIQILTNNPSIDDLRRAFMGIRRILSSARDPPIDEVIKAGFLEALAKALEIEDERVQFEAAWALTNIVSGSSVQTMAAVNSGVTGPLVKLCTSPSPKVAEQVIWAVANIVGDSAELRDHMIQKNLIHALIHLMNISSQLNTSFIRIIAWTLSNLVRHKRPQVSFDVLSQIVIMIARLLKYKDPPTQQDACWALSFMTDGTDDNLELAMAQNVIPDMVMFLKSGQSELIPPALRVLGNFATGSDVLTQAVVNTGILNDIIPELLIRSTSSNIKECCWLLSNIVAGTQNQIQSVLDSGLLTIVVDVLKNGESRSQFEAGWVVANIVHGGSSQQIIQLAAVPEIIPVICKTLGVKNNDLVVNMLETLYGIMNAITTTDPSNVYKAELLVEESQGLDHLETLQHHDSERIYELAYKIVDEFFNDDENSESNVDTTTALKIDKNVANSMSINSTNTTFNF